MASEVKFQSFSSGSCGNCYFLSLVEDGVHTAGVLIDAGVSLRKLKKELTANGYGLDSFDSVLVTHDHLDHIRNLASYCQKLGKNVWASPVLHRALAHHSFTRGYIDGYRKELDGSDWNAIVPDKIFAKYFVVPHDASETAGFALWIGGYKFVIMTDIGEMTPEALAYARNADTVVIESNYDMGMLMNGPYPEDLKMRICKGCGHLSNDKCADSIRQFWHKGLKQIFLCHLSENNNTPEHAFRSAATALESLGFRATYDNSPLFEMGDETLTLRALPRQTPSPLFTLR